MRAGGLFLVWSTLSCSVSAAVRWDLRNRNVPASAGLRGNFSSSAVETITTAKASSTRPREEPNGATGADGFDSQAGRRSSAAGDTGSVATTTIHDHDDPTDDEKPPRLTVPTTKKTTTRVFQPTFRTNGTISHTSRTLSTEPTHRPGQSTTTTENCTHRDPGRPFTVFSVIYDETITFDGDPTDYTPPFPPLVTPTYCEEPTHSLPGHPTTTRPPGWTSPRPPWTSVGPSPPGHSDTTAEEFPTDTGEAGEETTFPTTTKIKGSAPKPSKHPSNTREGSAAGSRIPITPTITFTTRAKNPSVVFRTRNAPEYTQSWLGNGRPGPGGEHRTALGGAYGKPDRPPPVFTIIAGESQVIINQQTLQDKSDDKRIVTVDHGVFTILPTAVVAHGHTITRPLPDEDGNAQGPNAGATAAASAPTVAQTDMAVVGGELLTAIGPTIMVLRSTTYVYGPRRSGKTVVVDRDTIDIGTFGVTVHGITLGGPRAAATTTAYEIVGGATITQVRPSIIIIEGITYTISAGMKETTTVVGGQTITIGPDGAIHDSLTIPAQSQIAITTTFQPSGTWGKDFPEETGREDEAEDDAGAFVRPDLALSLTAIGIILGVLVMA